MANPEHLKILRQGITVWNQWRKNNPSIKPDLSEIDFQKRNFAKANFSHANCYQSDFREANLAGASFEYANLPETIFSRANLSRADFFSATFVAAALDEANFEKVRMGSVVFAETNLSRVKGLDSVFHDGPSSIDIESLYRSEGKISDEFLRNLGVPEDVIQHLLPLIRTGSPIQWHSCFISYSSKDEGFAERLHSRMRQAGLRVWFAPEDMKGGQYSDEQIDRAIQLHDRLLLVLSEDSIQSKWVEREIRKTRKVERAEKRRKLFPITLTDYETLKKWGCLDSDSGEDLAEEVRKYHIPDFSNWKNHDAFKHAFARLEKDLRTSIGK
jgi:hypothetical protein